MKHLVTVFILIIGIGNILCSSTVNLTESAVVIKKIKKCNADGENDLANEDLPKGIESLRSRSGGHSLHFGSNDHGKNISFDINLFKLTKKSLC